MPDNIKKLRLYEDIFSADKYTDENSLSKALLTQPDLLSPVLTHLAGRDDKRFPLSFILEGMGRNYKYINDYEYEYPVVGRLNKAMECVAQSGTGAAHGKIDITFRDNWFVRNYIIEFADGTQVRLMEDAVKVAAGYKYVGQLTNVTTAVSGINGSVLVGQMAAQLFAPNAMSGSRGNESRWVAPSKMRNQISLIRKSYGYEGNVQNKTVNVQFNIGGKTTTLWSEYEEWQHMLRWKEEVETALWYSEYNKDSNGLIHLKDKRGNPIPLGSGVLEQIPNLDTFSSLTARKIKNVVRDALFGASDASQMNIRLYTGLGGLEEFDNAMKAELAARGWVKNTPENMAVTGSGRNLGLTGFFTSYEHHDGHSITVQSVPLFDKGPRALASDKHPITGLPMESYRMIFLDDSVYEGEPNIRMVTRKGREMVRWAVPGATIPKGFSGNALRAHDIDGADVHFMKECGVAIRRATNCLHLICTAS